MKLEVGKEYIVGEPEFSGKWIYVEEDKKNYIFAFAKNLNKKIIELHIPKEGIKIENSIFGKEYFLDVCDIDKNRKRFFKLAEKVGLIINKNLN